jgi:aspartyl-tRNA(Asn)/glutamyl-tRNA(Gln) amidotransferase subunit A
LKSYNRISEIQADLQSGKISCLELVRSYLENIRSNAHLNAFLEVWEEEALQRAAQTDENIRAGNMQKLSGVVIALKDVLAYKNHKVSASSKILEGFESLYSATAVQRLEEAGAIFIGRTNCDEFAMGASNENSAFGPVLNAADQTRVPGGSSGGSAVAVQAGMCHVALGTDTGGSIRQPAAFTGVYGFKPTYGAVSRWGLLAYASSFDQIGSFCRSVEDTDLIYSCISGPDEHDSTVSVNHKSGPFEKGNGKYHFAVMEEAIGHSGLNEDVRNMAKTAIKNLEKEGHQISYFKFPLLEYLVPAYYVITTAEASSNLSRYSGLLYGNRSAKAVDLESTFVTSRTEGFGTEVKRRIMLGTFVLSSDYYDAYYKKALQVRALIRQKTLEILDGCDAILIPTTSTPAFKIGEKSKDPIAMYLADLFTVQANLAGVPAISIPFGKSPENLPMGMQLITGLFEEQKLFALSETVMSVAE